jgi:FMN phosphatase YigB (HAD superfamily)
MQWKTVSKEEKIKKRSEWHLIFAWMPHKITHNRNGQNYWAWLEKIGRKSTQERHWEGVEYWHNIYASKEDALFYQMGGQEPEIDYGLIRPVNPPPCPKVKSPAPTAPPKKK